MPTPSSFGDICFARLGFTALLHGSERREEPLFARGDRANGHVAPAGRLLGATRREGCDECVQFLGARSPIDRFEPFLEFLRGHLVVRELLTENLDCLLALELEAHQLSPWPPRPA